ncbi:MAG: hypothetical protein ACOCUA_00130 [archaeon]
MDALGRGNPAVPRLEDSVTPHDGGRPGNLTSEAIDHRFDARYRGRADRLSSDDPVEQRRYYGPVRLVVDGGATKPGRVETMHSGEPLFVAIGPGDRLGFGAFVDRVEVGHEGPSLP